MNKMITSECSKKKLSETYLIIYAIKNEINIKKNDYIEKSDVYTLIGVDVKGYRELINIIPDRPANNRYWLDCFENLKSRGLKNVLFLSVDNNRNIKRTAKVAFPDISFVDSMTYIVPIFAKYSLDRDAKKVGSKLNKLYTCKTLEEYKVEMKSFREIYK